MDLDQDNEESIGELFTRLVDDGRSLIGAELALFRVDFYRRIGKAKTGVVMCLMGAILGQAAAVVLLISLAYALTPWLGRFGGSMAATVIGAVTAVLLLRFGVRRLMLIVDDNPTHDKKTTVTMEELFARAKANSRAARAELTDSIGDAQARLSPRALALQVYDELLDKAQAFAHQAVDTVRHRPIRTAAIIAAAALVLIRPPIGKWLLRLTGNDDATGPNPESLKRNRATRPAHLPLDEEKTS